MMTNWREGVMRILNGITDERAFHRIYNWLVQFYYLGEYEELFNRKEDISA